MNDYAIRAHGIPAIARVYSYTPYTPASWTAPADGPEADWQLLDRRGRPAAWLEKILTPREKEDLETEVLERCSDDYRHRADWD